jgi:hypothetical protein
MKLLSKRTLLVLYLAVLAVPVIGLLAAIVTIGP